MIHSFSLIDTISGYETPEGIELTLRPAGPFSRGLAWAIDMSIRSLGYIIFLILYISLFSGGVATAAFLILIFLIEWFYPVFFEMYQQATPGKKVLGIEVMQADGAPLEWSSVLLRNLLRTADFFPFLYGTGLVAMMLNNKFQRLGDLAAGTVVVYAASHNQVRNIPEFTPKPPARPFSLTEQRLILDFAERGTSLSAERRQELAALLPFLTKETGKEPEQTLLAYANWFSRGR